MKRSNYIGRTLEHLMSIVKDYFFLLSKSIIIFLILCCLHQPMIAAGDNFGDETELVAFSYDEIPVLVLVEGYKSFYVDAIYANNDLLYVNISELFQSLNIPCVMGQKGDSLGGFIENESRTYSIDYNERQIRTGTKIMNTNDGLKKEMGALYLESSLFAEAFGITMTFNYRALTLILKSDFELPVIRQQRLDKMRSNLNKLQREEKADTIVGRNYHLFRFGMADWSLASYQTWKGSTENRIGLGIGAELLYGEADVSVNYYSRQKFDKRNLFYLWRWVDNDKKIIKQAQIGKISNQTISFLGAPVVGAVIRNAPTTVRKATGYYTISEYTQPNWTIELYINNVLVDYTKADASGLFVFKVPVVYGYITLKLMFYGPMGEERTEERTMNIPYTVMPAKEFEYSVSAGIVDDSISSRFGRGEFNYGINRMVTVGGGLEYLSSIPNAPYIPFAKTTIQPFSKMVFTGEYAHGVKVGGLLDYYFWKDALLEIDYTKFKEGQLATRFNALEERKMKLSVPFRIKKIAMYSKFDYSQRVYKTFKYNLANVMLSAYYKQFNVNSSTQINWIDDKKVFTVSNLSLAYRPGKGYTIRPSVQYNFSEGKFMSYKLALEKSIPKGYLTVAWERYPLLNDYYVSVNFKFDLNFARLNFSVSRNKEHVFTSESAQGSLAFGSGNNHICKGINPATSKGGIFVFPFLDVNQNGIFDEGEHMVKLTSVKITGGKVDYNEMDSIIRITDLNAFTSYIMELNDNNLDNISWRFKYKTYQVLVDPNQFKRIDIPITVIGEASGTVYMNRDNFMKGIGRIRIKFYDKKTHVLVAETLSESDGYISYFGFQEGEYVARIDSVQLENLGLKADPYEKIFAIQSTTEGDIAEGIDFVLADAEAAQIPVVDSLPIALNRDTLNEQPLYLQENIEATYEAAQIPVIDSLPIALNIDTLNEQPLYSHENIETTWVWGTICTQPGNYYVQCGAFQYKSNALRMAKKIALLTSSEVGIAQFNNLYKVQVGCVDSKSKADEIKSDLIEKGAYDDLFYKKRE